MNRYFWSFSGLSLYLYAMSILTQYGFYSWFNVPYNFIDVSLVTNVVFYFQLLQLGQVIAGLMRWWVWPVLLGGLVPVTFFWWAGLYKKTITTILTVLFLVLLWGSATFGGTLAENNPEFFTVPTKCISLDDPDATYVAIGFRGNEAVFVPIASSTRRMTGGFLVRDVSQLPCKLSMTYTGRITK